MLKFVGWLALAVSGILFPLAVLAAYDVTGSSPPEPFQTGARAIPATVDIDPDTLNLKSEGQPVTAYIELPTGYDVGNIDVSAVRLCLGQVGVCPEEASIHAEEHPTAVGDDDGDTMPDLMAKFDRQQLIELLGGQIGDIAMTVAGMVSPPGWAFAGSDTIRVIDPGSGGEPADTPAGKETPQPPPAPAALTFEYQIKPGDTLFDIALRFGTTVETIAALNGLADANLVVAGQRLLVPEPAAGAGAAPPLFTSEYVVQPGDTLFDIALRFGTSVKALAAANRLANPSVIHYGDRLLVP